MQPDIIAYHHAPTGRVTYLIVDPATLLCAIVDPVLGYDPATQTIDTAFVDAIVAEIRARDLGPTWILETAVHTDHLSAAGHLKYETGASICIGAGVLESLGRLVPVLGAEGVDLEGWDFDKLAQDDEDLPMGGVAFTAIALPGRLPGAVAYRIGDTVFTGEALLPPDQGLPPSDRPGADAEGLHAAARKLLDLPPETRLLSGSVGAEAQAWAASVATQRATNVDAGDATSAETFAARRANQTPRPPAALAAALAVAVRAGRLPPADSEGKRFPDLAIPPL